MRAGRRNGGSRGQNRRRRQEEYGRVEQEEKGPEKVIGKGPEKVMAPTRSASSVKPGSLVAAHVAGRRNQGLW